MARSSADSWIVARPRPNASLKLLCLPYAGGNASVFRSWAVDLPADIEVSALQLPGRAGRIAMPLFTRLPPLIDDIGPDTADAIDRPFVLFGHSLGAVLAFELARWLRRRHWLQPLHLFVAGRRAPQTPDDVPPNYCKTDEGLIASLREMNGTPPEVLDNTELLELMLPTIRADFEVVETYEYVDVAPLDCPITVFEGADDPETHAHDLDDWRVQTRGRCSRHVVPGHHFFINTHTRDLLRLMQRELAARIP